MSERPLREKVDAALLATLPDGVALQIRQQLERGDSPMTVVRRIAATQGMKAMYYLAVEACICAWLRDRIAVLSGNMRIVRECRYWLWVLEGRDEGSEHCPCPYAMPFDCDVIALLPGGRGVVRALADLADVWVADLEEGRSFQGPHTDRNVRRLIDDAVGFLNVGISAFNEALGYEAVNTAPEVTDHGTQAE